MRNIITIVFIIFSTQLTLAQGYQAEFLKYCQINDTVNQLKVLQKWQSEDPKDAELYTSYFNYHFAKSKSEVLSLSTEEPTGERLVLKDKENNTAGYLGSQLQFDKAELQKGFVKIDEGIARYPNRLDMRFGKIYALGQVKDWAAFTNEILKTIDRSAENDNRWTWTDHENYGGGEKGFLLDIQNYQLQLYDTGNNDLLENMRVIAKKVLEHYPKHIESLSNLSITYLLTGEYDKALEPLLKAERINPKDYIVLANIAQGYKLKGDKQKAIAYYRKTAEFGDAQAKEFAKQQIAELQQ